MLLGYYNISCSRLDAPCSFLRRHQSTETRLPLSLQLMPETLFLTANLIDRFLEIKGVTRKNLQLVRTCLREIPLMLLQPCWG